MAIAETELTKQFPVDTQQLIGFYRSAIAELKERAKQRLVADGRVLTAEAKRARLVIREIDGILTELEGKRSAWIAQNVPKNYLRGVKSANLGLAEIGAPLNATLSPVVHTQAIDVLMRELQEDFEAIDRVVSNGFRTVTRKTQLRSGIDKMITEGAAFKIAEGKTARELSKEFKTRLIDEFGDKPFRVGKRRFSADTYAELVARTKIAEAQTAGSINRIIESGNDLVMVSAHGAKDGCGFYEGKIFSISGLSNKYPSLSNLPNGGPPFHPNCRHRLLPFVDRLASGAERRRGKGVPPETLGKSFPEVNKLVTQ